MATIAIVGLDGSGKTTIIKKLQKNFPLSIKFIYMGFNLESSNYILPTSRLALHFKLNAIKKKAKKNGITDPFFLTTHHIAHRRQKRGNLLIAIRTLNRLADAWYRQIVSWFLQAQGYLVIYDRHFLFDSAPNPQAEKSQVLSLRIYRWLLSHTFPKNDLVIFLDADPKVLLIRKQEVTKGYMEGQRVALLNQGKSTRNFVIVDAAQPLEQVYNDVVQRMIQFGTIPTK